MNLLVSIIIPIKGRIELAKETITSIYSQENIDINQIETILVEQKDYGEEIRFKLKKQFPVIKIFLNENEEGPGGARNTGLKYAKGKYIAFLDSDDIWKPHFLKNSICVLETEPDIQATVAMSTPFFSPSFPNSEKIKLSILLLFKETALFISLVFNRSFVPKSGFYLPQISHLLFKKDALKNFRFNYRYRSGGEDWALLAHVLSRGKIKLISIRLVKFRYSWDSSTMQKTNMERKWDSYSGLIKDLPRKMKQGILFNALLLYMKIRSSGKAKIRQLLH